MADDPYLPYGPDTIVIPFEIPPGLLGRAHSEPVAQQPIEPGRGMARMQTPAIPPSPAEVERRSRELATQAAATANPNWPGPEPTLVMAKVQGHLGLAISGMSDGEITLWRVPPNPTEAQPLATLRLDLDGSQLYAGQRFAGLLWQAQDPQKLDQALLHPDWLRDVGAVGPESQEPNPEEPTLEEHPEPLQIFPLSPRTPKELEYHHDPAMPVPPFGVPSSHPAAPEPLPGRAEPSATTPTGRRSAPFKILRGTNPPAVIGGRYYSGHALDKMQSVGITPSAVEHAIAQGAQVPSSRPNTIKYYDPINKLFVVVNQRGRVVTVSLSRLPRGQR